jgi:hypothetical protein
MIKEGFETPCPITGKTCVILSLESQHPGKEILKSESDVYAGTRSRTTRNNTMNADIARFESARYPEACLTQQTEKLCGALAAKAQSIWMPFGEQVIDLMTGSED